MYCLTLCSNCFTGKMGNKQTSALLDKCNAEEKVDKSSQPTHGKKDPTGRIEMFAVPMKITPTKPLSKATPKRITLTPVPVASNPTNQVTVQQVTSTAPNTAKNTAFMPAQKQANVGSSPVNAMGSQITPRRVPLMPASNSQPKKNNICGQVTPRRVPLTPVDTATPSTSSPSANGLKQGQNTSERKDSARSVPQVSTSSSGDSGAENKSIQRQTSSGNAPRRIKLTTLSTFVEGSTPPRKPSEINPKSSETVGFISKEAEPQCSFKSTPDSTINSSQPRRIALTSIPLEDKRKLSSLKKSETSVADKENHTSNQVPSNKPLQPRRVEFTTLTFPANKKSTAEGLPNSSKTSPRQDVPRRHIPLEPTIIVLDDNN